MPKYSEETILKAIEKLSDPSVAQSNMRLVGKIKERVKEVLYKDMALVADSPDIFTNGVTVAVVSTALQNILIDLHVESRMYNGQDAIVSMGRAAEQLGYLFTERLLDYLDRGIDRYLALEQQIKLNEDECGSKH